MACNWNNVDYCIPTTGKRILVKYNIIRSDAPYTYVVCVYDGGWKHYYLYNGYWMSQEIPKPDWWAYIEGDDEHE